MFCLPPQIQPLISLRVSSIHPFIYYFLLSTHPSLCPSIHSFTSLCPLTHPSTPPSETSIRQMFTHPSPTHPLHMHSSSDGLSEYHSNIDPSIHASIHPPISLSPSIHSPARPSYVCNSAIHPFHPFVFIHPFIHSSCLHPSIRPSQRLVYASNFPATNPSLCLILPSTYQWTHHIHLSFHVYS